MYGLYRFFYYFFVVFFVVVGWKWAVTSFGIDQVMCFILALILLRVWPTGGALFTICWVGYLLLNFFSSSIPTINSILGGILVLEALVLLKDTKVALKFRKQVASLFKITNK
ncbi:hypothetical protein [Streptococcus sobrinus]|uniref:hypothetical protein n=1 Tax=Streptococcus sobrinus TaxID=1310 RepID=UPI00037D8F7A|nr:hypothetical protein [Streptococcus sobrinus]